jgi:hypothetical protein
VLSIVPDILRIQTAKPTRLLSPKPTTTAESDKYWGFDGADIACVHTTFGDYLGDPIKRHPVWFSEITNIQTLQLTDRVRTRIPRESFQDAIISIEISTAEQLVKILFPQMEDFAVLPSCEEVSDQAVRVQTETTARDRLCFEGVNALFTLKGVSVSDVRSVFPPSICDALDKSQLRTWEKEHLLLESTDCVKIEIHRKKPQHGTIRLRVGYFNGVNIAEVLYV